MSVPSRPVDLAIFRIVVVTNVLLSPDLRDALRWSQAPRALLAEPGSWAPLPSSPLLVKVALVTALIAGVAALVGWRARTACAVLAALSLYLLAIPQRSGVVTHTHHLVWFLAILAASPCADALSVDAALAARDGARQKRPFTIPRPDPACALALACAWMLVGIIFFFPGAWKLLAGNGAWLDGSALRRHLHWKWFEMGGWTPSVRIDRSELACRVGGIATVLFELSFGVLVFTRRFRGAAIGCAILFHVLNAALMRVYFSSLWTAYVMFVDWDLVLHSIGKIAAPNGVQVGYAEDGGKRHVRCAILRTLDVAGVGRWSAEPRAHPSSPVPRRRPGVLAISLVGLTLLIPNVVMGVLGSTRTWPFACYPTFHRMPGELATGLLIQAEDAAGHIRQVPHGPDLAGDRRQGAWAVVFSLLGAGGAPVDPARLEAYVHDTLEHPRAREAAAGARRLALYRAWYPTDPEQRRAEPIRRELLLELPLGPDHD